MEVSMTRTFVSLRRIAVPAVAITLLTAPIAWAQTPASASSTAAWAGPELLSPSAFARLAQTPPADPSPAPIVKDPPRLDLVRHAAAMAREAPAPKAPPRRTNTPKENKVAWIVIGCIAGGLLVAGLLSTWGE
jgi:hypothetical protein